MSRSIVTIFEQCREACGECKSHCIENGDTSLLTICELCMLACTQMCMCLRRPTQCSEKLKRHLFTHCKTILKDCIHQCQQQGHVKCARACEKAHKVCCSLSST